MAWRDLLDVEEGVFRLLWATGRRLRGGLSDEAGRAGARAGARGARFESEVAGLSVLAQLLTGEAVRLRPAPGVGGLRGADLLLPTSLSMASAPASEPAAPVPVSVHVSAPEPGRVPDFEAELDLDRAAYCVQVVLLAGMRKLFRTERPPSASCFEGALDALRRTREAVDRMAAELPRFAELHERVMTRVAANRERDVDLARLDGREAELERARRAALRGERPWEERALVERLVGPRMARARRRSPALSIWSEWIETPGDAGRLAPIGDSAARAATGEESGEDEETDPTEREAPAVGALRRVDLDFREEDSAPPIAPFERVETLDRYRGGKRDLDGADELDAHLEALEQADLGDLIRTNQPSHSFLKADLELGVDVADAEADGQGPAGIAYDEWDASRRRYRRGWCTVYPSQAPSGELAWAEHALQTHRDVVRRLRLRLEIHRLGLQRAPRQTDGEEIDLDAALADHIERRVGHGGDLRLYVRSKKRRRDFATLVLLDVSMSTDSWVQGRRVLDVAREAALVLGEVADQLGDRVQILAFASETRNRCQVWKVFSEGEPWALGKRRLAALEPRGYTRIGPALRHATAVLERTPAERRLLLLISDGKPTDYDRYEGRYGIADIRTAIREAHAREIHTHGLAVDAVARDYLPALFGQGGFHILAKPDQLVESLTEVYGRLTAR
jgi:nitric oxide reductase NorD protein